MHEIPRLGIFRRNHEIPPIPLNELGQQVFGEETALISRIKDTFGEKEPDFIPDAHLSLASPEDFTMTAYPRLNSHPSFRKITLRSSDNTLSVHSSQDERRIEVKYRIGADGMGKKQTRTSVRHKDIKPHTDETEKMTRDDFLTVSKYLLEFNDRLNSIPASFQPH